MTSAATPSAGTGFAPPSPQPGRGCGARRPAARLSPPPQQRLAQVPLPPFPASGLGGAAGEGGNFRPGPGRALLGRALLGRLLATGRAIEGLSRPRRGTARRPEGSGLGGPRRPAPAEPRDPASRCEGAEPFGAAGRRLPAREGLPPPRPPWGPTGRGAQRPLQAAGGGRRVPALGGGGGWGEAGRREQPPFPCPPAGRGCRQLPPPGPGCGGEGPFPVVRGNGPRGNCRAPWHQAAAALLRVVSPLARG